jgi:hypothetical protein
MNTSRSQCTAAVIAVFALLGQPCFGQINPVVWRAEAEAFSGSSGVVSIVTENASTVESYNVSGTQYISFDAADSEVTFTNVFVPSTGVYRLTLGHWNVVDCEVEIRVDGVVFANVTLNKYVSSFDARADRFHLDVSLVAGTRDISIRTTGALDLDYLLITRKQHTTYYVSDALGSDTNDGLTALSPLKSLDAISAVNLFAGDKVLFRAGETYTGLFSVNGSGTNGYPVLISRYGSGLDPVITGSAPGDGYGDYPYAIYLNNVDWIEIADVEISNDRTESHVFYDDSAGYGVYVHNNAHRILEHFHFRNITVDGVFAVSTSGIEFDQLKVAGVSFRSEKNLNGNPQKYIKDVQIANSYFTMTGKFGIWSQHGGGETADEFMDRNHDYVFRGNHFYQTGGSGITPGKTYNCLVEYNTFEYSGSNADPRMAKRGSGAWFFSCRNVLAQYNVSKHARGDADSYGMHIDFGNKNVILQYNYSEDSEGGFCEILGNNINSCYRYNVSVNDGFRNMKGNAIWVSDYAGASTIKSDFNYVYNNTIYVDADITPDISITAEDTYIYNNIFHAVGNGRIGESVALNIARGSELILSNNLFYGNVSRSLTALDTNAQFGNSYFMAPGGGGASNYYLLAQSPAIDSGVNFPEPEFPAAGTGIFAGIPLKPTEDMFGNPANASSGPIHIGACNGPPLENTLPGMSCKASGNAVFASWSKPTDTTNLMGYTVALLGQDFKVVDTKILTDVNVLQHVFTNTASQDLSVRVQANYTDGRLGFLERRSNLLLNSGYETGVRIGWNSDNNAVRTDNAVNGNWSGVILSGAGSWSQTLHLAPTTTYFATLSARLSDASDVAEMTVTGHLGAAVPSVPITQVNHSEYLLSFTTGNDPRATQIRLRKTSGGELHVDNFRLMTSLGQRVIYDDNGSESGIPPVDSYRYVQGQRVYVQGNIGNLTRTGYVMNAWNTASDGSGTIYTAGDALTIGGSNATLFAHWVSLGNNTNTYMLAVIGGSGSGVYAAGSQVSIAAYPPAQGYGFYRWLGGSGSFASRNNSMTTYTTTAMDETITANYAPLVSNILVGGAVRNGNFNANPLANAVFSNTPSWYNLAGAQSAECTRTDQAFDGTPNAVISSSRGHAVDTAYSIRVGDVFDISYVWKDAFNWVDASDQIKVSLFVTSDNTLTGTRSNLVTDLSGKSTVDSTYENVDHNAIYTANASVAGKELFAVIETTSPGFARMDNFELIVTPSIQSVTLNHAVPHAWLSAINTNWSANYEAVVTNDVDGDGFATWQEYWSGTNPQDSNSFLRIDSIEMSGSNLIVKWRHSAVDAGIPPITIQARTNLVSGSWVGIGTHAPTNGVNTWSTSGAGQQFYRLSVPVVP